MGAGKTTVARALAERLAWPVDDSDASIEATHGRDVRQLRDELGTDEMHALEAQHLLDALVSSTRAVIAPAASIIDVEACRQALVAPGVVVVWLRAKPETLAERFRDQPHRPWYGDDPETFLAAQAGRRYPLFGAVADIVVDVDGRTVDDVVTATQDGLYPS